MMFGFMNEMTAYNTQYKCYSVSMLAGNERADVEKGGKIILPPSALDKLTRLNIVYPMLFKLTNKRAKRATHCGVLEFVADEGKAYIPYWMMQNLYLQEGDLINIQSASLPVATFARFQPQTVDFLDITNPKAVLESVLRYYACLTKGDVLAIKYNDKIYELMVLETKPENAVSIIECDMQVDFAPPVGYIPPQKPSFSKKKEEEPKEPSLEGIPEQYINRGIQNLFPGSGSRLDGKKRKNKDNSTNTNPNFKVTIIKSGIPDLNYRVGKLEFKRVTLKPNDSSQEGDQNEFQAFEGDGQTLRKKTTSVR